MWKIDLVEIVCAARGCNKPPTVILKTANGQGYFDQEVYCRKHGLIIRDVKKNDWTARGIAFQDLT